MASEEKAFNVAIEKVLPKSPKTNEMVVEVGIPNELKVSRMSTLVTITARNMVITSAKE